MWILHGRHSIYVNEDSWNENNKLTKQQTKDKTMQGLTLTARDFLVGRIVNPGWYQVAIEDVEIGLSKDGGSTNYVVKGSIVQDADSGSKDFEGVPLPRLAFNSKAAGYVIPLFKSLGVTLKPGDTINWDAIKGQKIVVFIGNKTVEDATYNDLGKNPKYRMADGTTV